MNRYLWVDETKMLPLHHIGLNSYVCGVFWFWKENGPALSHRAIDGFVYLEEYREVLLLERELRSSRLR